MISAVTITPERRATLLFSDPYIDAGSCSRCAATADQRSTRSVRRTVGVQINTTAQFDMEKRAGVILAKYNTIDLALLDLQNGRLDAVVGDAPCCAT